MISSHELRLLLALALAAVTVAGCGDYTSENSAKGGADSAASDGDASTSGGNDHGHAVNLGSVTLQGKTFEITRHGEFAPGVEAACSVTAPGLSAADRSGLGLYLWVEDEAGTQLSAPEKGGAEGEGWHFHVTPRADTAPATQVVLRLRHDGKDERAALPTN